MSAWGVDAERPRAQLEAQTANAGESFERLTDLVFLGAAVHGGDKKVAPSLATTGDDWGSEASQQ